MKPGDLVAGNSGIARTEVPAWCEVVEVNCTMAKVKRPDGKESWYLVENLCERVYPIYNTDEDDE